MGLERGRALGRRLSAIFDKAVSRQPVRGPARRARRRDAVPRAARPPSSTGQKRSLLVNVGVAPFKTADGAAGRLDHRARGRHRSRQSRRAAAPVGEDGGDRPAGGRRRARSQHAAHRHLELHADAARTLGSRTIPDRQLLEKIERQTFRAAKIVNSLLNLARPSDGEAGPVDLNASSATCCRCSSISSRPARIQVRKELAGRRRHRPRRRIQAAAGVSEPVPERARRDAERRMAVRLDAGSRTARPSSSCPIPASAFPPSTSRAFTIRSSRRRPKAAAPVSGCR